MRPHEDSLPQPLDHAGLCHYPLHRLCDTLRIAAVQRQLAEAEDACRPACVILAMLRERVNKDVAEVRRILDLGE